MILDTVKTLYTLAKKTQNLELEKQIADLEKYILKLQNENTKLRQKIQDLEKKQSYNMVFNGAVYIDTAPDNTEKGKYCPTCWDSDDKAIRVHESNGPIYNCKKCENYFKHKDVKIPVKKLEIDYN